MILTSPGAGVRVPKAKPLISIVDDDESMREAIKGLMKSWGYRAEAAASADEFLRSPHVRRTSCLIADVQMPGMSGLDLQQHLARNGILIPTIMITAHGEAALRGRHEQAGLVAFLLKPLHESSLFAAIDKAIGASRGSG